MQKSFSKRIRSGKGIALGFALLTSGLVPLLQPVSAQAQPTGTGVACTTAGPNPTFTLEATDGYIQLPDGNTAYMWGYALAGSAFQHPGPVLCVNQGDTVTVVLRNNAAYPLPEDTSIMFPGQLNVKANDAPAQPQFDGTGKLTSLTNVAPMGGSVTYTFVASDPGSYVYESGTLPQKQVRMGLFGALIVRPTTVPTGAISPTGTAAEYAYNRADSRFTIATSTTRGEEFMVLLSEIDPYQHQAVEEATYPADPSSPPPPPFNLNNYHARYWLINGRGFPDSISDNFTPFLPDQPYGALARITPFDAVKHPYPGRIHYLNVGSENFPFHPHGNNGLVIGRDGRPLAGTAGEDLSFEKFAINIGPGQTWDVLFKWYDAENYSSERTDALANFTLGSKTVNDSAIQETDLGKVVKAVTGSAIPPGTTITAVTPGSSFTMSVAATATGAGAVVGNAVPVTIPQVNNVEYGMFYGGSPYLGQTGPLPPGASTLNECGSFYIISHNHALFQITSWGVNMSGPITYVRVDPPLPNNCP